MAARSYAAFVFNTSFSINTDSATELPHFRSPSFSKVPLLGHMRTAFDHNGRLALPKRPPMPASHLDD